MEPRNGGLTPEQYDRWSGRTQALGLDPENPHQMQELELRDLDFESLREAQKSILFPVDTQEVMTRDQLEQINHPEMKYINDYFAGRMNVDGPETLEHFKQWVSGKFVAISALDVTVTKEKPLVFSKFTTVANFGTVTLEPGGYIECRTQTHFYCEKLIKKSEYSSDYPDILILGDDGGTTTCAVNGIEGSVGENGKDACTCTTSATKGCHGGHGSGGGNGCDGLDGLDASTADFTIRELTGHIIVLNQGGNGGHGSDGGSGGNGGDGGYGGHGLNECHLCGGDGGNGGHGGHGGNGGNGGHGSQVTINYSSSPEGGSISPVAGIARGGRGGKGGACGHFGQGGSGGTVGNSGHCGTTGNCGKNGLDGQAGFIQINEHQL